MDVIEVKSIAEAKKRFFDVTLQALVRAALGGNVSEVMRCVLSLRDTMNRKDLAEHLRAVFPNLSETDALWMASVPSPPFGGL